MRARAKIHLLSLELPKPGNGEYLLLEKGYVESLLYAIDGTPLGLKEASLYDSVKVAAFSVIQSGSTQGEGLQSVILQVAVNYADASGSMTLDANGDRVNYDFNVFGYYEVCGVTQWINVGHYDSVTGKTKLIAGAGEIN